MSYIAERREEEKERRRAGIIEAAIALYADVGWDAVTMDQIARKARLSRALVYVYFKDKDDLLYAISGQALTELRQRFEAAAAAHALGVDRIQAIGRAYVAFQREVPHLFDSCARFHAHEFGRPDAEANESACVVAGQQAMQVIEDALRRGVADGSIRADIGSPEVVGIVLWSFTHGLIQIMTNKAAEIAQHGARVEAVAEQAFEMLRFLLAGPRRM